MFKTIQHDITIVEWVFCTDYGCEEKCSQRDGDAQRPAGPGGMYKRALRILGLSGAPELSRRHGVFSFFPPANLKPPPHKI